MTDYKDSLNLPQTAFAMKANLSQREPVRLQQWQAMNLYQKIREISHGRPRFILHDGPPYANARPHMGTALNKTLKDIIVKSKVLSGFDAPYVPGWDCHGLPIEFNVEKKVGKPGIKILHKDFIKACRDYATQQVALQMADFQRMGVLADWAHPYLTMQPQYEASIVRALAKVIENGHLHRGAKPVHWCPLCASALAEAEVEYENKTSPAIDVAFSTVDAKDVLNRFKVSTDLAAEVIVPIWTTTPWTLPANQAVCLNASIDYALVKADERYLVLANDLVESVLERLQTESSSVLATVKGEVLAGIPLQHPFIDRLVPIILGDHVTTETGTGNVHTAPAHGVDDYVVGLQHQLPLENPVNANSVFVEGTPYVAGQHVYKANEPIIVLLTEKNKLLHHENVTHSYPHCWRHKKPLIFRATPQWFISMQQQGLAEAAKQAIESIEWIPAWGAKCMTNMVEGRPDWCISRQRLWGAPITLFIHKETAEIHPDMPTLMEKIALHIEKGGMEAWLNLDPVDMLGEQAEDYMKVTDTLDVWFDAGISHFAVLDQRDELSTPADLYLEGSDQHRGWFQSSLLTSLAIKGKAPYTTVLTHGYVVDKDGRKMSKSLQNVTLPSEIIDKLGADVMRLWVAGTDYLSDIAISKEILSRTAEAYRRIRNTARFLLSNLYDFNPEKDCVDSQDLLRLDRYAIARAKQLQTEIIQAYDTYNTHAIYQLIHHFCTNDMGSFYLDVIKDRLYTCKADGVARRSAQTALYHIAEAMVRWLAPITSFTAEEIWENLPGEHAESVFLSQWYEGFADCELTESFNFEYWASIMRVRDTVNKVIESMRADGQLGSALEAEVVLYVDGDLAEKLERLGDELRFVLITSAASVSTESSAQAIATDIEGLKLVVRVSEQKKCERCWHRRADVGMNQEHPSICGRCVDNIVDVGEVRQFA